MTSCCADTMQSGTQRNANLLHFPKEFPERHRILFVNSANAHSMTIQIAAREWTANYAYKSKTDLEADLGKSECTSGYSRSRFLHADALNSRTETRLRRGTSVIECLASRQRRERRRGCFKGAECCTRQAPHKRRPSPPTRITLENYYSSSLLGDWDFCKNRMYTRKKLNRNLIPIIRQYPNGEI